MDGSHFDTLSRTFSTAGSRRRAVGGLLLGALGLRTGGSAEDTAAHDLTAKCKKKSGEAKKTCLKKAKKHNAMHTTVSGCERNCAGKQCGLDGCGGSCGTCTGPRGQVCDAAGQCVCPACGVNQIPDPFYLNALNRCRCCTRNGYPDPDAANPNDSNCCSGARTGGVCTAQQAGAQCQFDEQCLTQNCAAGRCSSCVETANYCAVGPFGGGNCGTNGRCLKSVDGTTRCGIPLASNPDSCGVCNANDACDQGQFPGRFCAVNTGSTGGNCPCANGQTFCASPA
jgi:hypothetical protein